MSTSASQQASKPKVLILTGPTAVGKTKTSLALAERLNGEIISADSVQVYRGLDIGSDKISVAERHGIPHHLLDILDPHSEFSAGNFYVRAREAAADILQRGKTPIVVGGTGFYLRWFVFGKPSTPASSAASEAQAQERLEQAWAAAAAEVGREPSEEEKWRAGVALVESLGDHESAARLASEMNNYYRLRRVVDILLQSGGKTLAEQDLDEAKPLDYDVRAFFLHRPRAELYSRIDLRVEQMVAGGLLQEAAMLLDAGLAPNSNCASRAIGYRQALDFLTAAAAACEGPGAEGGEGEAQAEGGSGGGKGSSSGGGSSGDGALTSQRVVQLVKDIQTASRKLCHRQMVWFRDDALFKWIDATAGEEEVLRQILESWEQPCHEGGCGNSGRLTKEEERAMRAYLPKLELFANPDLPAVQAALEEARGLVQARRQQQQQQTGQQQEQQQQEKEPAGISGGSSGRDAAEQQEQQLKRQRHE